MLRSGEYGGVGDDASVAHSNTRRVHAPVREGRVWVGEVEEESEGSTVS